jgi:hypothetical protein
MKVVGEMVADVGLTGDAVGMEMGCMQATEPACGSEVK